MINRILLFFRKKIQKYGKKIFWIWLVITCVKWLVIIFLGNRIWDFLKNIV